jgi:hypothetical protein
MPALHLSSDASSSRRRDAGLGDEVSPELVLVDPDLAARARAHLPWPEPTFPRPRRAARVVPVASPPAAAEPPPAPLPEPLHFGRRLVAAATLVPALVTLALIAEFLGRSASPLGATTTTASSPATTRHATTPVTTTTATTRSRPSTARPSRSHTRKPAERRSLRRGQRPEGVVAQMGNTPGSTGARGAPTSRKRKGQYCSVRWAGEGLTLVYVARVPKNPCTDGRVVGGYVTGPSWRTAAGLSVGSSLARLRRLYPNAAPTGSGWWKLGTIRRGKSRRIPLHAHVTDGRVDKILVN